MEEKKHENPYTADGAIKRKGGGLLFDLRFFLWEQTLTIKNAST
jgi:hypothetical protein